MDSNFFRRLLLPAEASTAVPDGAYFLQTPVLAPHSSRNWYNSLLNDRIQFKNKQKNNNLI